MKTFKSAMGWGAIMAILIFFASCGKNSGGAGGNGPIEPPKDTSGKVSISANSSKGWYNDTVVGSVSAVNAKTITASPGSVSGGTYMVPNVTGPVQVRLVASGNNNQSAETTVVADCWSTVRSLICKNGTWTLKENRYKDGSGPWSAWFPVTLCFKPEFSPEGTWIKKSCTSLPDLPPASWTLNGSEDQISFGTKTYKIVSLTDTEMILEIMESGQTVQERYTH